ncbi:MAG: histidinol-phosphate transaminase [Bacteroidia bacterium]|nr:histidinol-phosphate transaminase [Bacteroidia bacterium]
MINLEKLVRPNIWALKPYSCARDEFKGEASVYLDANENPYNGPYNRYPDPRQWALKDKIAKIKDVRRTQIMLGNGSDEPIDLVIRIFCEPGVDNVVGMEPSYGMYVVSADINNVAYKRVPLNDDFSIDPERMLKATDEHTKIIWCCSPNNPSGNLISKDALRKILTEFQGIVVIDEAYADFSSEPSWLNELDQYPNLVVLQTFSKAWGMASVRCGMAFASETIIDLFNKVKYPYNINILTQEFVSKQLDQTKLKQSWVNSILEQRPILAEELKKIAIVEKVYPSDANFILIKVKNANITYKFLVNEGIIVRNRNNILLCNDCLRITVGTPEENKLLIESLKRI